MGTADENDNLAGLGLLHLLVAGCNPTLAPGSGPSAGAGPTPVVPHAPAWQIAGIRIDAGAPGLADAVRAQFGQSPQIRIILHPVFLGADGTPVVQDIAAHLIFSC